MPSYSLGLDIGGTFTDLICMDLETGELKTAKVPSTPPDYIHGIMNALKKVNISASEVGLFKHGSTVGTNAITQRVGVKTGLVTTKGFRDVLLAARGDRSSQYDLSIDLSEPLVQRRNILTVSERVNADGQVVTPIELEEAKRVARIFKKRGIQAIAVCFINSFMNPTHEFEMKEILKKECPEAYVSVSYDVSPEVREFERTSTVTVNAFLSPIIANYVERFRSVLEEWGYQRELLLVHSGGGVMSIDAAKTIPARMILASRAAGVVGGSYLGKLAGFDNVITFEMGGTTTDVSLVKNGQPSMAEGISIDLTIVVRFPSVDTVTIGAGGGSIAWIDSGGILRVGPHSAQAVPGPACYGAGGTEPTITDAMLVLGRLNEKMFLGGDMVVRKGLSIQAISRVVGNPLGLSVEEAAEGIVKVARSNISSALSVVSVERGNDPREFAMVAFGGAGPLMAPYVAFDLAIPLVMLPRYPGLNSPMGILGTDIRHDFSRPVFMLEKQIELPKLNHSIKEVLELAESTLAKEAIPKGSMRFEKYLDVRVYGQPYRHLTLPLDKDRLDESDVKGLIKLYNDRHAKEFGYALPPIAEVEIASIRVAAFGSFKKFIPRKSTEQTTLENALKGTRNVFFGEAGGFVESQIYDRSKLGPGLSLKGPAIIEQVDSTVVVPPNFTARVDDYLNIILEVPHAREIET